MKHSWFPIFLVSGLLGLLGLLATLQYKWLGQISDGDRERLQERVQMDTRRFAEDFNREIQNAYFNFQLPADVWRQKNWQEFSEREKFWRGKTTYPQLIKNFYFIEAESGASSVYNRYGGAFEPAELPPHLSRLKENYADSKKFRAIDEEIPALLMPIHDMQRIDTKILIRERTSETLPMARMEMPKRFGVLIVELDGEVLKNQILPDLTQKYFGDTSTANFKVSVNNEAGANIFQTQDLKNADASAKLFDLEPDNFVFFANRELLSTIQGEPQASETRRQSMVFSKVETSELRRKSPLPPQANRFEIKVSTDSNSEKPRVQFFEGNSAEQKGIWTLNVQHADGSLEQFITNTRRKNLAISFGILSLLGVSIVLIFLSAQRAKRLAQRQLDFVSSVSHEFRTPLAVIYSASENLADGVAREQTQVSRYGNLIKGEGKKLSAMVEQILEFAGARSGRRKYDFRQSDVGEIVRKAIAECQPMIEEKDFTVEREIAENLPFISADKNALVQAVQNLIANSIKYSDREKFIKISARHESGKVKIAVEDKGVGISPRDLAKIFEPFYRAKEVVDAQIHGNGLGLSIVKQIVGAHGGQIKVESVSGKGSKFTIEL